MTKNNINKNDNSIWYWECEKRKGTNCKARATTKELGYGRHQVLSVSGEHNHGVEPERLGVTRAIAGLKRKARETSERPVKLLQGLKTSSTQGVSASLPSLEAQRKIIKRVRKENRR